MFDLTHTTRLGMPAWPGDPPFAAETIATVERDGYFLRSLFLCEHTGTHFGAPAHFHADGITADMFAPEELVRPAVTIDVRPRAARDRDFRVTPATIVEWEAIYGRIPEGCVVLVATGWSRFWSDPPAYAGIDGRGALHFPGVTVEAARLLGDERRAIGLGIDTLGIDGGDDATLAVNAWWLAGRRYHLENLKIPEELPPTGLTLVAAPLKIEGSSGAPARVLAW